VSNISLKGGLLTTVLLADPSSEDPFVPTGALLNAMYPYTPLPPQNSEYPGHSVLQLLADVVEPGA
jgi:hypothetical protein